MPDTDLDVPVDASAATDKASWLALISQIAKEEGFLHPLGPDHWAMFVDDSPTLMVSFETIEQARNRAGQMPLAHHIAAAKGWSHLCILSDGQTWFRDPAVYAYFDSLVDEAFFDNFDSVLFYGAGPQAHAACAFSVASPGAQVLALNPVATLNPAQAGWDDRFRAHRKRDFTTRYGYAPDMVDGCANLTVIFDPARKADTMHATLFHAPYVTPLHARFAGAEVETALSRLGILNDVIIAAAEGRLTTASFATLWRKRRDDGTYLKYLLNDVELAGKNRLAIALCSNVVQRLRLNRFRKRLSELTSPAKSTTATAD